MPITWQNITSPIPSDRGGHRGRDGGNPLDGMFDSFTKVVNDRQAMDLRNVGTEQLRNTNLYMDALQGIKDPSEFAARQQLLASLRGNLDPTALRDTRGAEEARLTATRNNVIAANTYSLVDPRFRIEKAKVGQEEAVLPDQFAAQSSEARNAVTKSLNAGLRLAPEQAEVMGGFADRAELRAPTQQAALRELREEAAISPLQARLAQLDVNTKLMQQPLGAEVSLGELQARRRGQMFADETAPMEQDYKVRGLEGQLSRQEMEERIKQNAGMYQEQGGLYQLERQANQHEGGLLDDAYGLDTKRFRRDMLPRNQQLETTGLDTKILGSDEELVQARDNLAIREVTDAALAEARQEDAALRQGYKDIAANSGGQFPINEATGLPDYKRMEKEDPASLIRFKALVRAAGLPTPVQPTERLARVNKALEERGVTASRRPDALKIYDEQNKDETPLAGETLNFQKRFVAEIEAEKKVAEENNLLYIPQGKELNERIRVKSFLDTKVADAGVWNSDLKGKINTKIDDWIDKGVTVPDTESTRPGATKLVKVTPKMIEAAMLATTPKDAPFLKSNADAVVTQIESGIKSIISSPQFPDMVKQAARLMNGGDQKQIKANEAKLRGEQGIMSMAEWISGADEATERNRKTLQAAADKGRKEVEERKERESRQK